ncbi:hypothetical protein LIPSTDRAFT_70072 [Lipomyces starkeyi NRRL Y-11557]|uniref:Uncharacterized protein n=1 Tax=Lipomyces starkeyi NRRL Y-11557 TaxID=675824 RepID=A0A1E3Q9R3_LIPST|nr:hypothetical protein LIPSTDRAFT_70072 [Lipomyces starkeyi NRRL Y-11557]
MTSNKAIDRYGLVLIPFGVLEESSRSTAAKRFEPVRLEIPQTDIAAGFVEERSLAYCTLTSAVVDTDLRFWVEGCDNETDCFLRLKGLPQDDERIPNCFISNSRRWRCVELSTVHSASDFASGMFIYFLTPILPCRDNSFHRSQLRQSISFLTVK